MLRAKIFENRCDVLIITRDVSAYDDYVPERAKQLQRIAMSSLSGSAGRGPAAKRRRYALTAVGIRIITIKFNRF